MVLTTHYMEEAERLADRVGIVNRGRLLAEGTPSELTAGGGELRIKAAGPFDVAALGSHLGVPIRALGHEAAIIETKSSPAIVAKVAIWAVDHGVHLTELRVGASGLEEVFLEIAKGDE